MDFGVVLQTTPPSRASWSWQDGGELRVRLRVDVRQPHPVAGAVRHLQPDPGRDAQRDRRADGHQPGHSGLDRHRQRVRDAQRDVRQPHGVRHRSRGLGGASHQRCTHHARHVAREHPRHPRDGQRSHGRLQGQRAAVAVAAAASWRCGWPRTVRRHWRSPARWATGSSCSSPTCRSPSGPSRPSRDAAAQAGRDPDDITICVAAPAYVTDGTEAGLAYGREQVRWFGGMVGNHVADIVARYGDDAPVPQGAHRLHQEPSGLRLQRARAERQHAHHVRARRDRRPLLHRRPGRDPHRAHAAV